MPVYQKRAVLFLDMLGFGTLVKTGKGKDILYALSVPPAYAIQFMDSSPVDLDFQFTAFSDCIVYSVRMPPNNNFSPAAYLVACAGQLALGMLTRGILVRGAITVGELYHNKQTVFGPALIEAYEMESRLALYPRIILPGKVSGGINLTLAIQIDPVWMTDNMPCRQDFDGMWHLDIFGPFYVFARPAMLRLKTSAALKDLGPVTKRLVNKLCQRRYKDPKISAKYEWLKYYFDDCCARFGWKCGTIHVDFQRKM